MNEIKTEELLESPEERLDNIYDRYRSSLGERILKISMAWRRIRQRKEWNKELHYIIAELVEETHKLSGSAGIFGYEAISDIAAPLEYILHHINEEGDIPSSQRIDHIELLVDELIRALDNEAPVHFAKAILGGAGKNNKRSNDIYHIVGKGCGDGGLREIMEHHDYKTLVFDDISKATKLIKKKKPAAVLVDLTEIKNSSEALRMVEEFQLEVPFTLFVDEDDFDTRLMVAQVGGRGYMLKPIDEDELVKWLDHMTGAITEAPYEVLIVDSDMAIAQSYAVTLIKSGMRADVLDDPKRILDVLAANKPDVILLDVFMPNFSGIDLAKMIRQQTHFLGIPIMFMTHDPDITRRYQAMIYGADDILQKPISPTQLVLAVVNRAARARTLRSVMERDSLTGLFNHAMLKDRLLQELDRSRRVNRPVTFALLDLDLFKKVNDQFGHVAGDMVLKALSKFLMNRLRKTDIVGRYGGEEFAVILTDSSADTAYTVLDELRRQFSEIIFTFGEHNFQVTFSGGLCEACGEGFEVTQIIETADKRLYKAKEQGRNKLVNK